MSLLNELGKKYRTDKATDGKRGEEGKGHDYLRLYEKFPQIERHSVKRVLEIGVQRGASIRVGGRRNRARSWCLVWPPRERWGTVRTS